MRTKTRPIAEIVISACQTQAREGSVNPADVLMTGFGPLDGMTGGILHLGCVTLLTGTSPMANRSMAYRIVSNAAVKEGKKVVYTTLSGSPQSIVRHILSIVAGISPHSLRRNRCTEEEVHRLAEAKDLLSGAPLFVADAFGLRYEDMIHEASSCYDYDEPRSESQLRLIVIDDLSELSLGADPTDRHQEIEVILMRLADLAQNHEVAILLLADLKPNYSKWVFRDAAPSDLPYFPAIAPHVDAFVLLDIQDEEPRSTLRGSSLSVFRNHCGKTGKLFLNWDRITLKFSDSLSGSAEEESGHAGGAEH